MMFALVYFVCGQITSFMYDKDKFFFHDHVDN
jgi:hypothetical protein